LKRDAGESKLSRVPEERFPWFLGVSVLLFAVEALLVERRRGKKGGDR
jgi:hypothetical protein